MVEISKKKFHIREKSAGSKFKFRGLMKKFSVTKMKPVHKEVSGSDKFFWLGRIWSGSKTEFRGLINFYKLEVTTTTKKQKVKREREKTEDE